MSIATRPMTADELFRDPPRERCELLKGELQIMSSAGGEHGWIIVAITSALAVFVKENQLGYVFGAETGFIIERDPGTVRAPDVAYVRTGRFTGRPTPKFIPFAPDLAVEVLSPNDTAAEVQEKVEAWLNAGTQAVWVVDPKRQTALICRQSDNAVISQRVEELSDDSLLPGFRLSVASLFE